MCRFIAYIGKPILIDELVIKPKNSLIRQSSNAQETRQPLNGDGFGLGWYDRRIDETPATFRSTHPAWNDLNLINLAQKLQSECFFAHIRDANMGGVAKFNCHPFRYDNMLFMHNGLVGDFSAIKRYLRRELSDASYEWIKGQTDSEHLCALFIDILKSNHGEKPRDILNALTLAIKRVIDLQNEYGQNDISLINLAVTDGKNLVALRFSSKPEQYVNSLYYSLGSHISYHDGITEVQNGAAKSDSFIIASEKLNNYQATWKEVPVNHALLIDELADIYIEPMEIKL